MIMKTSGVVSLLVLFLPATIGWWSFNEGLSEEKRSTSDSNDQAKDSAGTMVPFEMASADQKFLQEANQLLNLSPLDNCQHNVSHSLKG